MRHPFGPDQAQKACDAIAFCVGAGRLHANTIDIPGVNFALEHGHRDGKDAGTGAEIEDGARPPLARHEIQHVEAAARRTMVAGAKSQRGLDLDCDVIRLDRVAFVRAMNDEASRPYATRIWRPRHSPPCTSMSISRRPPPDPRHSRNARDHLGHAGFLRSHKTGA